METENMTTLSDSNRRSYERKATQVIVHFNFHGHEKVFESVTRDISCAGMFIETDVEILDLMDTGAAIITMIEYQKNFLLKLKGYIVRIERNVPSPGFAMKFLNLDIVRRNI